MPRWNGWSTKCPRQYLWGYARYKTAGRGAGAMSRLGVLFMRALAHLPLSWVRVLGWALGWAPLLDRAAPPRGAPQPGDLLSWLVPGAAPGRARESSCTWRKRGWTEAGCGTASRRSCASAFDFGRAWGAAGFPAHVIFAPHFVGLDAGWTALTQQVPRAFTTIYTTQANQVVDAWILAGRRRFGSGRLFGRADGVKPIVSALREGAPLYLLPDMNFGPEESIFVPFYGVPAATVPSLSRFARLGRAKVVPVTTRMTRAGYEVRVLPAWDGFSDRRHGGRHRAHEPAPAGSTSTRCPTSTTGSTSGSRRGPRASPRRTEGPAKPVFRWPLVKTAYVIRKKRSNRSMTSAGRSWMIQWLAPSTFSSVRRGM